MPFVNKCKVAPVQSSIISPVFFAAFFKNHVTEPPKQSRNLNLLAVVKVLYLEKYGRPVSFYVDHHAVYSVNLNNPEKEKTTQVGRAFKQLGINLILAHSPQAKGRVEGMNATLQDRLVN
jgi:hypothetical protein